MLIHYETHYKDEVVFFFFFYIMIIFVINIELVYPYVE